MHSSSGREKWRKKRPPPQKKEDTKSALSPYLTLRYTITKALSRLWGDTLVAIVNIGKTGRSIRVCVLFRLTFASILCVLAARKCPCDKNLSSHFANFQTENIDDFQFLFDFQHCQAKTKNFPKSNSYRFCVSFDLFINSCCHHAFRCDAHANGRVCVNLYMWYNRSLANTLHFIYLFYFLLDASSVFPCSSFFSYHSDLSSLSLIFYRAMKLQTNNLTFYCAHSARAFLWMQCELYMVWILCAIVCVNGWAHLHECELIAQQLTVINSRYIHRK